MSESAQTSYGFCLGASTVTAVEIEKTEKNILVKKVISTLHEGNPKRKLREVVEELNIRQGSPVLVTGRKFRKFLKLPSVTEPEAVEYALEYVCRDREKQYDTLVSAGGETFLVYKLNRDYTIGGISTGNKCASGTGEFFMQQIRRMDLEVEDAVALGRKGSPYTLSGRCSVFCKSDCTHALNKGESIADVTAGLCKMISKKITEIIKKNPHGSIMMIGGTANNKAVVNYLRDEFQVVDVPEEAVYFEALGAALGAGARGRPLTGSRPADLFLDEHTAFGFLEPLKKYESYVKFNTMNTGSPGAGDICLVGLDVGSTTTKAVLLRLSDNAVLASVYLRTNGNPVEASRSCYRSLLSQLNGVQIVIHGIGVTGSGRQIAGLYSRTGAVINEIIAHARGAVHFDGEVDTIFEIGGQDAKYTYLTGGVASDYAMNQACSAGTGSFLEESAHESLGVKVENIAEQAIAGLRPPNFNDQCSAFISSDIKNASHEGLSRKDILAGLVYSICFNYINRVKGNRPVGDKIFMQGGVCYNRAVPLAMAGILKKQIIVPPEPGLMGALGVALELKERIAGGTIRPEEYNLEEIIAGEVTYEEPFICTGGKEKCDLKCSINRIRLDTKVYPFGGACNRYYNIRYEKRISEDQRDFVVYKNNLMMKTPYKNATDNAVVIGLNMSFITLRLFPLYRTFFSELGFRIITSGIPADDASNYLVTSLCFPVEIAIGLFKSLLEKNPDYIFIPHVKELYVPGGIERHDFCSTCGFSRGEAFYLRQAFHKTDTAHLLAPTVNFNGGWEKGLAGFLETAAKLGVNKKRAGNAFNKAVRAQYDFEEQCVRKGDELLKALKANSSKAAIILFGRPYNAFTPLANKGIPRKFTSRGYTVIPFDMIDFSGEPLDEDHANFMTWEAGQRILRVARIVKKDLRLFGVFITNFLCAPDSFIVPYFRKIMGKKPSLTLELDAHTADAGINTRIDAFLDIINNYRKIYRQADPPAAGGYKPARIRFAQKGIAYVDSKGEAHKLTSDKIKMILPPMGDLGVRITAAALRKRGIRAEALPPSNNETLLLGRSVTTGKECLPLIMCIGSLVQYLKHRTDKKEKVMMLLPKASGHCRLGQYHVYTNQFIRKNRMEDVALLDLGMEERFAGLGTSFILNAWKGLLVTDVMEDIGNALRVLAVDKPGAMQVYDRECNKIIKIMETGSGSGFYKQLNATALRLKEIKLRIPYKKAAKVALTGEFFVRRDPFSNLEISRRLAESGFVVITSPIAEIMYYANFMIRNKIKEPRYTLAGRLEFLISEKTQRYVEKKIKKIMAQSGLFTPEMIDVDELIRYSEYFFPKECDGEHGLIIGLTMRDSLSEYCAVVHVGPFGCMQSRFADANLLPHTNVKGKEMVFRNLGKSLDIPGFDENDSIPFLSIESDGNPYPQLLEARYDSFCLEAERTAGKMGLQVVKGEEIPV